MSYVTNSFDNKIIELLKSGGVGFMPADTIYGLSCRAMDESAVNRLHEVKMRNAGKPFIILISDIKQLSELGVDWSSSENLMNKYWPGALTIVLPALSTPDWLTKGIDSLAVRLPKSKKLTKLINEVGPIVSTSANEAGEPAITNPKEAQVVFGDKLDFYVDAGELPAAQPSTIIKSTAQGIEVLRQGAVKIDE